MGASCATVRTPPNRSGVKLEALKLEALKAQFTRKLSLEPEKVLQGAADVERTIFINCNELDDHITRRGARVVYENAYSEIDVGRCIEIHHRRRNDCMYIRSGQGAVKRHSAVKCVMKLPAATPRTPRTPRGGPYRS